MSLPIASDDLPAVVAELRENGVAYYAVEGDLPDDLAAHTRQVMFEHGIPQGSDDPKVQWMGAPPLGPITDPPGRTPPSEWVTLAEAKPKHTLTVECSMCDGEGFLDRIVDDRSFYPSDGPPDCHRCDGDGTVSVDVVVRDVLPVRATGQVPLDDGYECVVLTGPDEPFAVLIWNDDGCYPITPLGPDLAPGMFVVVIEVAS